MSSKKFEDWFISHEEECVKKYKEVGGYEGINKFFGEFCEELYVGKNNQEVFNNNQTST